MCLPRAESGYWTPLGSEGVFPSHARPGRSTRQLAATWAAGAGLGRSAPYPRPLRPASPVFKPIVARRHGYPCPSASPQGSAIPVSSRSQGRGRETPLGADMTRDARASFSVVTASGLLTGTPVT